MRLFSNYITLLLLLLLLIQYMIYVPLLEEVVAWMTFLVILLGVIYANKINKIFAIIMIILGAFLLFSEGEPVSLWLEAVTNNLPLVSLIVIAPMLSIPVRLGKYDQDINNYILRYARKPRQLYSFISVMFFFLSPLLNLGALHLIHSIVKKLKLPKDFLGRVYLRSFFSANTWAPYFASVFLVVYYLQIPFNDYVQFGIILGISQIIVSYLLFISWEQKFIKVELTINRGNVLIKKLIEFSILLVLLICAIFLFEEVLEINIIIIITNVIIFFTILWSLYLKQIRGFVMEVKKFFHNIIPHNANEIVLFLSAGFFSAVISNTVFGNFINKAWQNIAGVSIFLIIITTILIITFLSFLGIHHIVTISILLTSVSHQTVGVSDLIMAMTLLSGYAIGAIVSPVSPPNVIVSNIINEGIYHMIIRYNLTFALLISFIQSVIIFLLFLLL